MSGVMFVSEGLLINYVPESNLTAGDVVVAGALLCVAKYDLEAGKLGAVAIQGIFSFPKTTGIAFSAGDKCYWDEGAKEVTNVSTHPRCGIVLEAVDAADERAQVKINSFTKTTGEGGGAATFLELIDTPAAFTGQGAKIVTVNATETGLEFADAASGDFAGLSDTPTDYTGQGSKVVTVKAAEDGLEFTTITPGSTTFTGLTDTPVGLAGEGGKTVRVNAGGTALEFVDVTVPSSFPDLDDTPASYTGNANKVVAVNGTADGLVFIDASPLSFTGLTDTPSSLSGEGGKMVRVNVAEDALEFVSVSDPATTFTGLTDTPANYSGGAGYTVKVNAMGDGLEFVSVADPPSDFVDLGDTPSTLSGEGGKTVRVNAGGTALEFVDVTVPGSFTDLGDTPASYTGHGSEVVAVTAAEDGLEFTTIPPGSTTFTGLTDTPADFSGAGGYTVRVNSGATALEFVDVTVPSSFTDLDDTPSSLTADKWVKVNAGGTALELTDEPSLSTIESNTTYYLSTTGHDDTGDGTSGSPWATLAKAFQHLQSYRIQEGVTVTISVGNGTYTSVPAVTISHPDASRIEVIGEDMAASAFDIWDITFSPGNIEVQGDQTAKFPAGAVGYIMGKSSATNVSMEHCQSFVVSSSSYSGGTGRTTITPTADLESGGTSSGNGTLYTCPSSYNCVFEMAASAAITVTAGTVLGEFTGVCIQGNATTPGHGLVVEQGSEISASENLVIRDCDEGLRVAGRSGLYATTPVVHGNASHGFHLLDRSFARFTDGLVSCQNGGSGLRVDGSTLMIGYSGSGEGMKHAVSDGNANKGLFCFAGGMATAGYLAGSHNGAGGIEVATGSTVNAPWSCLRMNAKGVVASGAARALCAYSRVVGNANDGVKCTEGSFVNVASGNCSYNTGDGILCQDGASVKADTVTATNNDKGVVAEDGSFVNAGSGTVSSNTTDNFSPTANSVGNSNSYIKN